MSLKKHMDLLALSFTPEHGTSILDWRPFEKGETLDEIIHEHNLNLEAQFQDLGWLEESIEDLIEGINVLPTDLSALHQLRRDDFKNIRIILVDLESFSGENPNMPKLKERISRDDFTYLPQVGCSSEKKSLLDLFKPLPIIPSRPDVLLKQDDLKNWLNCFSHIYGAVLKHKPEFVTDDHTRGGEKVDKEHLSKTIARIRDVAMKRDLNEEQITVLADRSLTQEFALNRVARTVLSEMNTKSRVVLDGIRQPLDTISIENLSTEPTTEKFELLKCHLIHPIGMLNREQKRSVINLGIEGTNVAAVHFNHPHITKKISGLKGIIKATKFSTDLPSFKK
jgi:hypothetical protein